jgi:hypothetical protein
MKWSIFRKTIRMYSPVYLYTLPCDKHPSSVSTNCTCVSHSHVQACSLKDKGSKYYMQHLTRTTSSRKENYDVTHFVDMYIPSWCNIDMGTLAKSEIIIDIFTNFRSSKRTVVTAGQIWQHLVAFKHLIIKIRKNSFLRYNLNCRLIITTLVH